MKPICFECGYSLGDLDAQERCPECGADAEFARRTLVQRFARPQNIRDAFGWSLVLLAILAAIPTAAPVLIIIASILVPSGEFQDVFVAVVGAFVSVAWFVSWAFLAACDPSVRLGRLRSVWSNLAVIALGVVASIALVVLFVLSSRDTFGPSISGIILSGAVPLLALAQLCLGGRIATRLIALCHRRPRRVWVGVLLQLGAGLLCIAVVALTVLWILDDLSNGNGRFPVTIPATITFYLTLAVILLTVLTLGRLSLVLRHASRRYKAHLAQARTVALPARSTS